MGTMRILVVEDDHKLAAAIKQGLEHESHVVDLVYTGSEGYEYPQITKYDLIVLDRMLPEMEGTLISKKLRQKNIHTPIIMLTAKGEVNDRVSGLDSGVDDYLVKPFAFSELLARIRALTRRLQNNDVVNILKVGGLTLDINTFEVKLRGIVIELSGKEYALLEYLMRNQGKIVTKDQIMSHVWDFDSSVMPNFVEVYINHLRNKLDDKTNKFIKTIRGFGYKLGEK